MIPGRGRVIGVDLGSKRVGVAVCDADPHLATGVTALHRSGDVARDHRGLAELVADYGAVGVVVGLPRSLAGHLGPAATGVLSEVEQVRAGLDVPVETIDERLTTVAASSVLRSGGRPSRKQRSVIDQVAAAILLQSWLDRRLGERRALNREADPRAGGGDGSARPVTQSTEQPRT